MKGAPKQAEKVGWMPAFAPTSVEPTLAVYPLRKWNAAASLDRMETGGSTPDTSQVRNITHFGSPPALAGTRFSTCSSG